ncbi:MAG TPA: nucleotide exchange factor GrpE [Caulobacteraceae bacterium]
MTDDETPADAETAFEAELDADDQTIEELAAEVAEWREKALRAAAEAENTRRRAERDTNDARAFAIQRFAKDLLQAADSLERALTAAPRDSAEPAVSNFLLGIEMTEKAMQSAFERNGLKRISPEKGAKFDPHLHQAMMEQDDPQAEPGTVSQTMQPGYELFGRIVRPAMVIVVPKRTAAAGDAAGGYQAAGGSAAGAAFDTKA